MINCSLAFSENNLLEKINYNWRWVHFDKTSGLQGDKVSNVLVATDGTVWAISNKGMYYYDNYIWHFVRDEYGFLYQLSQLACPDGKSGLVLFHQNSIYNFTKNGIIKDSITNIEANFKINNIKLISENKYLALIKNNANGIIKLGMIQNKKFNIINSPNQESTEDLSTRLFYDNNQNIYFQIKNQLYKFDKNNTSFNLIFKLNENFWATKIAEDNKGNIFLFIQNPLPHMGVWKISSSKAEKVIDNHLNLLSCEFNLDGEGIFSFFGGRIFSKNKNGEIKQEYYTPLQTKDVSVMTFDKSRDLWLVSNGDMYYVRVESPRWEYHKNWKNDDLFSVNEMVRLGNGDLWIGANEGIKVLKHDGSIEYLEYINNEKIIAITGLAQDSIGNIWVSSGSQIQGAWRFDGKSWKHFTSKEGLTNAPIHKIKVDKSGKVWFLSLSTDHNLEAGNGVFYYDFHKFVNINSKNGLVGSRVYDIAFASDASIWFATGSGISKMLNNKFTNFTTSSGLRTNKSYTIAVDKENKLWFSDNNFGVGFIDKSNKIHYPSQLDSGAVMNVTKLEVDKHNNLWIASGNGFHLFAHNNLSTIDKNTGLLSAATWPFLIEGDSILIGTAGYGINIFKYAKYKTNLPRVYIDKIDINDNNADIEYRVFAYKGRVPSDMIQVRYKIDNGSWSEWTLKRDLHLRNISWGRHNIFLQAKGLVGNLSNISSKQFIIEVPIYFRPIYLIPFLVLLAFMIWETYIYFKKRKESNQAIIDMNRELENRVVERTEQLRIALKELTEEKDKTKNALQREIEMNEIKTNFISMLSHEYRTPLTIISSSAYLIEKFAEKGLIDKIKKSISRILDSVQSMTKYADDALVVNRLQENTLQYNPKFFNLDQLIVETIDSIRISKKYKHEIVYNNYCDKCEIYSDDTHIVTIMHHLIDNAMKYSPNSDRINVELKENFNEFLINIIDYGNGIKDEDKENIFKSFYRAKEYIGLVEGIGLGLHMSRMIVNVIGAKLSFISTYEKGSTFTLHLSKLNNQNDNIEVL